MTSFYKGFEVLGAITPPPVLLDFYYKISAGRLESDSSLNCKMKTEFQFCGFSKYSSVWCPGSDLIAPPKKVKLDCEPYNAL